MSKRNRLISIREVLGYMLNHIATILIVAIICSIAFVGCGVFAKGFIADAIAPTTKGDSEAEQIYNGLSYNEQIAASVAINDFEDYYSSFELIDKSILEKIDSYNARKMYITYSLTYIGSSDLFGEVQVSKIDQYSRLLYCYVIGGDMANDISDKIGIESLYVQDCLNADYNVGAGVVSITVWGTDVTDGLEDAVMLSLEDYISQLSDNSDVEVSLIKSVVTKVRVSWIFENQKAWEAEQTKLKTRLDTAVAGLSDDAYNYFMIVASEEHPEFFDTLYSQSGVAKPSSSISAKTIVKYGAVGAIGGVVVYGLYALFLFMYSKKIVSVTDYTDSLGLRILADVKNSSDDLNVLATKITATCTKQRIKEIALISTNEDNTSSCAENLKEKLTKNGLNVTLLSDFLSDHKVMGTLFNIGNCVIIERMGSSLYSSVLDEVDLCNENSINIIGLVNLDKKYE